MLLDASLTFARVEWQLLHLFVRRFFLYLGVRIHKERLEIREIIFPIDSLGKTISPKRLARLDEIGSETDAG